MVTAARRITVNLSKRGADALDELMTNTGETRTDCVNKALRLYALAHRATAAGGAIAVREAPDGAWERLRLL